MSDVLKGAADTENLVVRFFNGKTETVAKQTSVWIPLALHDRVKLEIQMPVSARQYLASAPLYPAMLPPGYSVKAGTGFMTQSGVAAEECGYLVGSYADRLEYPVYVPVYPDDGASVRLRMPSVRESAVRTDDVHRLIPGTNLTKEDLNRKVMQQLMDNKMIPTMPQAETAKRATPSPPSPHQPGILRKSVSFRKEEGEMDSGIDSFSAVSGLALDTQSDPEYEEEEGNKLADSGTQTLSPRRGSDYSLLYKYKDAQSLPDERPPWQHWNPNSKSSRPLSAAKRSKAKPFRDTALCAPAEAKLQPILAEPIVAFSQSQRQALLDSIDQDIRNDRAQLEWMQRHPHPPLRPPYDPEVDGPENKSGAFQRVDHQAKNDRAQMEWTMKQPRPPAPAPVTKHQGVPAHRKMGSRDMVREAKEKAYLEYRRNQVMQMEARFSQLETDARNMKAAKEERCRRFAADVVRRDVQRQKDSEEKLRSINDAKRSVSASIARQQQERSNQEGEREAARLEALRQRGQRREEIAAQREREIQRMVQRRQEIRQQRQDDLTRRHVENLVEQNQQEAAREAGKRDREIRRRDYFYNKEQKNQEAKDLRLAVREQKYHDLRSQVLP